jgi:three-Cys-motif partner protein
MPAPKYFFNELKEWSERKLTIVQKYLDGFTKILGSIGKECVYYVDGFAGRGIYQGGEKGSPVLAAEIAQRYRDEGKRYRLYCINTEEDADNFSNLQAETTRFGNLVRNLPGRFTDNFDTVLQDIGNCPAFFFVDDFGVKGTEWD